MQHVLKVMDSTGDSPIAFDDADLAAKAEAEQLFERLLRQGHRAVNVHRHGGKEDEFIHKFSSIENETLLIPPIVGG